MSTKRSRQCNQCGYYLNGRAGLVCSRCFNLSLVPVECKFCKEQTLIREGLADARDRHVCFKCDWEHRGDIKCSKCGEICKDALYPSQFNKEYNCKKCCGKELRKCRDCGCDFWGTKRTARAPLCNGCRLKNYAPAACIECKLPRYFHKLRKPETCICNSCHASKHDASKQSKE